MNNEFLKTIPFDHTCALCKKKKGQHQATSFHCPVGMRGRANTYSFSRTQVFTPRLPKLPVAVKRCIAELENAALSQGYAEAVGINDHLQSTEPRYLEARYKLHTLINQLLTK